VAITARCTPERGRGRWVRADQFRGSRGDRNRAQRSVPANLHIRPLASLHNPARSLPLSDTSASSAYVDGAVALFRVMRPATQRGGRKGACGVSVGGGRSCRGECETGEPGRRGGVGAMGRSGLVTVRGPHTAASAPRAPESGARGPRFLAAGAEQSHIVLGALSSDGRRQSPYPEPPTPHPTPGRGYRRGPSRSWLAAGECDRSRDRCA